MLPDYNMGQAQVRVAFYLPMPPYWVRCQDHTPGGPQCGSACMRKRKGLRVVAEVVQALELRMRTGGLRVVQLCSCSRRTSRHTLVPLS